MPIKWKWKPLTPELEVEVRELLSVGQSIRLISSQTGVSQYFVQRVRSGYHVARKHSDNQPDAEVISARIFARTEYGRLLRIARTPATEDDLRLAPEVAASILKMRADGFIGDRGGHHAKKS